VKLFCVELIKHQAIKMYSSECIYISLAHTRAHTLNLNISWDERLISHTCHLTPLRVRGWMGPKAGMDSLVKRDSCSLTGPEC
jgi:hypothetical protein